jgi:dihydrofolate reductase
MTKMTMEISMSLDGYVAGPNQTLEQPLGEGGERLHDWVVGLKSFRDRHGLEGGEDNADSRMVAETVAATGAVVMGRRMFSGGSGPWEEDPNGDGWWGDDPPFHVPVFVLTHHPRETVVKEGGTTFTFVTDGIESASEQARAAAGERDVAIAGGADVVRQYLTAGHLDELLIHIAPVLLGGGVRLFDGEGRAAVGLEQIRVAESPGVTHLTYRVVR